MLTLVHLPKQRRASRRGATGAGEGSQGSKSWSRSDWPLLRSPVPEQLGQRCREPGPRRIARSGPAPPNHEKPFLTHEFYGRAKREEKEEKGVAFHRIERRHGEFRRVMVPELPRRVVAWAHRRRPGPSAATGAVFTSST